MAGRSLRHDSEIFQGGAEGGAPVTGSGGGPLDTGRTTVLIVLAALAVLTVFRTTISDILPD